MGRWRAIASSLTILVLVGLCGACSNGTSKPYRASQPARAAQAKAAATRARVAAAKRRLAVAQRKVAAQRRAIRTAARRRAAAKRRAIVTAIRRQLRATKATTTTTTTTTTVTPHSATSAGPKADLVAVERTVDQLNAAFRASVAAGIANSETANYWVGAGVYTSGQCASFEAIRGGGVVSEALFVHPETFTPSPGWVDPVIGSVPGGRIYRLTIDEIQTLVPTGEQRGRTFAVHATVRPDGRARLFLRCA